MAARQAAEAAGRDGAKAARNHAYSGMSLQEAKQILHVPNTEDVEAIQKVHACLQCPAPVWLSTLHTHPLQRYEHLLKVNEKQSGGSFYLQSKVTGPGAGGIQSNRRSSAAHHQCYTLWVLLSLHVTFWVIDVSGDHCLRMYCSIHEEH